MIAAAASELLNAGIPRSTVEAEIKAIGIALYAMVELRRMQNGLPQLGS